MKLLKVTYLILLTLLFKHVAIGQNLAGVVINKSTKAPLAFVHVGIKGKNSGSITQESGEFELNLSQLTAFDTILFSHIGYETLVLTTKDINKKENNYFELEPAVYEVPEIQIWGSDLKSYTIGRKKTSKITTGHNGKSNYGVGKEWGLLIKYEEEPYYIKDINFHTRYNTVDSVLFRINIYELDEFQLPGKSIPNEVIYTKSYKRDKWISSSIIDHNILIDKNIIVTFETIRIWYKKRGKNHLFFTHGEGYEEGTTYSRESSHSPWEVDQAGPIAMYLNYIKY